MNIFKLQRPSFSNFHFSSSCTALTASCRVFDDIIRLTSTHYITNLYTATASDHACNDSSKLIGDWPCGFTAKRIYHHADLSPMTVKFSHRNEWLLPMSHCFDVAKCAKSRSVRVVMLPSVDHQHRCRWNLPSGAFGTCRFSRICRLEVNPHGDKSACRSITNELTTNDVICYITNLYTISNTSPPCQELHSLVSCT